MALLAAVEATLLGRGERLVAKCDVPGILAVFERWDIYDVATLSANLAYAFAELQRDLAPVAALSFLALHYLVALSGDFHFFILQKNKKHIFSKANIKLFFFRQRAAESISS